MERMHCFEPLPLWYIRTKLMTTRGRAGYVVITTLSLTVSSRQYIRGNSNIELLPKERHMTSRQGVNPTNGRNIRFTWVLLFC